MPRSAKPAPVRFPNRGTPPDATGYPHYARLELANHQLRAAYERLLKERRKARQTLADSAPVPRWNAHKKEVTERLAAAMGLRVVRNAPAPERCFDRSTYVTDAQASIPEAAVSLRLLWYRLSGASWDQSEFELLVLRPHHWPKPRPTVLLIPDAGIGLTGAQSPEAAAREWGLKFAAQGFTVGIPRLPGLERLSSTHNKKRIVEGASALGEVAFEAAQALGALLNMFDRPAPRAFVAGSGFGALTALFLGALDGRVAGVLAESPLAWGGAQEPQQLLIGGAHQLTDLPEITALCAPKPLVFVKNPALRGAAEPADVNTLAKSAAARYRRSGASNACTVFPAAQANEAIEWLGAREKCAQLKPTDAVLRAELPSRRFATWRFTSDKAWRSAAVKLRREYPGAIGIPESAEPLHVLEISRTELPAYSRTEYHLQTGAHTWSNVVMLLPRGLTQPRPTVLHLPGSGSDVAKVEREYAYEIVAQGWNACVIDARAALYPFHPGIAEGRAILPQGLHDLRCATNWVFEQACVDKARVATMGVSQGGTHSWMLTAVEPRICATAPVCGICTYASLDNYVTEWYGGSYGSFFDSHSIYYFPPALLTLAEQQDVCALIAPRPFLFIGATHDNCFPVDGMREAARDIRHVYKLLNAEKNFVYYEFDGPHSMPEHTRKAAYAFFKKVFTQIGRKTN